LKKYANTTHPVRLLRTGHGRPRSHSADKVYEIAPLHIHSVRPKEYYIVGWLSGPGSLEVQPAADIGVINAGGLTAGLRPKPRGARA